MNPNKNDKNTFVGKDTSLKLSTHKTKFKPMRILTAFLLWTLAFPAIAQTNGDHKTLRVFIFAGQ